jgi:hypothetical protein
MRHISLRKEQIKNFDNEKLELEKFVVPPFYGDLFPLCIHVIGTEFVIIKIPTNEKTNRVSFNHRSMATPVLVPEKKTNPNQGSLFPEE